MTLDENHVWNFNFTSNQWTWISGNPTDLTAHSVGKGVESPTNIPAARDSHSMNSLSSVNSFLVFGGYTFSYQGTVTFVSN